MKWKQERKIKESKSTIFDSDININILFWDIRYSLYLIIQDSIKPFKSLKVGW